MRPAVAGGAPADARGAAQRPWKLALLLLAGMGALFFSTYGLATWLASQRAHVPSFHYEWEHAIPFVPWSIIPYWSIDLLYALSFFLWRSRAGLLAHARRLLMAQLISVACFIAFPLRFAFERPAVDGLPGQLFALLGNFDKPFNQAPSLHIGLLVILWVGYARHVPRCWRWLLHGWFALIGLSVLTTYQHHLIDVPTGWLVGWLCVFAFPIPASQMAAPASVAPRPAIRTSASRTSASRTSASAPPSDSAPPSSSLAARPSDTGSPPPDPQAHRLARRYALGAGAVWLLSLGMLALSVTTWLILTWLALALGCVAWIYRRGRAEAFGKRDDGALPLATWFLMAPYIAGAFLNSRAWTRGHSRVSQVAERVWIGRLPGKREMREAGADALLDLTAEFPRLVDTQAYCSIPVLDLTVPAPAQLRQAVRQLSAWHDEGRTVLVCCALGYSRSALVAACWLALRDNQHDTRAALARLYAARPVVLGPASVAALERFVATEAP